MNHPMDCLLPLISPRTTDMKFISDPYNPQGALVNRVVNSTLNVLLIFKGVQIIRQFCGWFGSWFTGAFKGDAPPLELPGKK